MLEMDNEEKELLHVKQAVLTTKHLTIKGESIKLSDVLEAYSKISGWTGAPKVMVTLRDGSTRDFLVPDSRSSGAQMWGMFTSSDVIADSNSGIKSNVDRWVNLINRVIASPTP